MSKRKFAMKVAKMVTKAVGAADLADYAGSKIAKARAKGSAKKFVEDKTSGKRAAVSAAALLASVAPGGAILRGAKVAKKGVSVAKKAKELSAFEKKFGVKIPGQKKRVKIVDNSRNGQTINKGDKWSDWGWTASKRKKK